MSYQSLHHKRNEAVWQALSQVSDPELDQSVTELGFIDRCEVDAQANVRIEFRLPTYWCAANFAFMMGHDMVENVTALAWVDTVSVELLDHFYAAEINRGLASNASFEQTCGDEATGDLVMLRATFRHKAFMSRQERLLDYLLNAGYAAGDIVGWSVNDLAQCELVETRGRRLLNRYLTIRRESTPGDFSEAGYRGDCREWAFVTATGESLTAETLAGHRQRLRSIRSNTEFNAHLCSSVLQARKANGLAHA